MMLQTLWKIISVSLFHRYCHHCRCRSRRHSYHVIFIYFNFSAVLWVFWSIFVRRTYSSCIKVSITLNWRMAPSIMLLVCVAYIRVESSVMATAPENFSTLATRSIEFLRQLWIKYILVFRLISKLLLRSTRNIVPLGSVLLLIDSCKGYIYSFSTLSVLDAGQAISICAPIWIWDTFRICFMRWLLLFIPIRFSTWMMDKIYRKSLSQAKCLTWLDPAPSLVSLWCFVLLCCLSPHHFTMETEWKSFARSNATHASERASEWVCLCVCGLQAEN